MKIKVLGSGGYHPSETRETTCIMIPEYGIVLDAGTGFFRVRENLKTDYLKILLSHAHLDHSGGLTYLHDVLAGKFPQSNVEVYGLNLHLEKIRDHLFDPGLFSVSPSFNMVPIDNANRLFEINGIKILYREQKHAGTSVGYRLTFPSGQVIVFITDTTTSAEDLEFVRGADLLIHECYNLETEKEAALKTNHSWLSEVTKLATDAKVKKLALIHINPLHNEADPLGVKNQKDWPLNFLVATDNLEIEI